MEGKVGQPKDNNTLIYIACAVLVLAVGGIYITPKVDMSGTWMDALPAVNASINAVVSVLLVTGFVLIRRKNMEAHRRCMTTAFALSLLFLVTYVAYHITHESTKYGGEGIMLYIYLFILLTHILLAIAVTPMVLITLVRALNNRFDKHKRLARITFPLWLYVSVTGVLVYLMISPYY